MADLDIAEFDPVLMAACIRAATSIAIARQQHSGAELEKFIAERAFRIYEATVSRFGLIGDGGHTLRPIGGDGAQMHIVCPGPATLLR